MSLNHGAVWWSELMTRDVPGALDYYRSVCGWSIDTVQMEDGSDYHVAVAHGKPATGIMDMTGLPGMDKVPPHWFTYLAVDDTDVVVEQTLAAGGTILRPPFDVAEVGRIVMVTDPTGAAVGFMTPVFPGDALVEADAAAGPPPMGDDDDLDDDNFPV